VEGLKEPFLSRFQVSPSGLIDTKDTDHPYRLLQNNSYGLVATDTISAIEEGQHKATVGAHIVIINKQTGEILWHSLFTGPGADVLRKITAVQGKCIKD